MIVTLLAALSLSAAAPSPMIEDGRARLAEGDARGAMIQAERAVRDDPSNPEARILLARALLVLGEADRAEKMARAALRDGGGDPARLALAEALYSIGQFGPALETAREAAPDVTQAALVGLAGAERALQDGQPEEALGALRAAIAAPGFERRAELAAARAHYARGDLVRASLLLDGLIEADDLSFPALLLRARVALRSGDAERAGRLAEAMLARDPGNVSAGAVAIEAALRRRDRAEARRLLSTLAPLGDDPRPAYLNALILLDEGRTREAGDAIAGIESWLQGLDGGAVLMARVRGETGRLAQAEKILRDRLRGVPTDVAAWGALIDVLLDADKPARADEALEDALRAVPDAPLLRAIKAERLIASGQPDAGLALLADEDPVRAELMGALFGAGAGAGPSGDLALAYAALRRGDQQGALRAASRAVKAERTPAALNLLAAAQARAGLGDVARATLAEAISADPDFLAPIANLAALDGEPGSLLKGLERAKAAGASGAPVLSQLAAERFAAGRSADAADAAREAWMAGDAEAGLLYARIVMADGASARRILLDVIASAPTDPAVVLPAAALLEAAGRAADAAPALAALARRSGSPRDHLAAAAAAAAAGDDQAAVLAARAARSAAPQDGRTAEAILRYETVLLGLDAGLALVDEAAPLSPAHARAVALDAAGQPGEARAALLAAPTLDTRSALYVMALARGTDDAPAATEALTAYAKDNPGDVGALVALSAALIEAGRETAAEDALRRALAARPGDPIILNNLASLRAERDPSGALALAETAYGRAPTHPGVAATYAEGLLKAGRRDHAARVLRRARLASPADADLAALLAMAEG